MRISTRASYGLRAMLELAAAYGSGPLQMSAISANLNMSRKYLHSLLTSLRSAGLVHSVRGTRGGYILAHPPSQISLDDVVRALEGPFSLTNCVEDSNICKRTQQCVVRDIWVEIGKSVQDLLAGITLENLIARQKKKRSASFMYYI